LAFEPLFSTKAEKGKALRNNPIQRPRLLPAMLIGIAIDRKLLSGASGSDPGFPFPRQAGRSRNPDEPLASLSHYGGEDFFDDELAAG